MIFYQMYLNVDLAEVCLQFWGKLTGKHQKIANIFLVDNVQCTFCNENKSIMFLFSCKILFLV